MKVQIWSDIMCPFCYIGKGNLEQALSKLPFGKEVEIEWKSFQLDPDFRDASGTKTTTEYLMEKKGMSRQQVAQIQQQLTEMGKASGAQFNHEKTVAANTFLAHQVLHLAKAYNKSNEMEEALFVAHFQHGKNIGDPEVLISLAETLGLDREEARSALASDKYADAVKQDILEGRNIGVTGVPFFVLNNKYAVSGAQPIATFVQALTQTYNETIVPFKGDENAGACTADGCDTGQK